MNVLGLRCTSVAYRDGIINGPESAVIDHWKQPSKVVP